MNKTNEALLKRIQFYISLYQSKHQRTTQLLVLLIIVGTLSTLMISRYIGALDQYGLSSKAASTPLPLQLAFTHPQCSQQPTANGKALRALYGYRNLLYMGCGDWGANTGPITITSYDPITQTLHDEFVMRTEQIASYVEIGNRLCAPAIDPGGGGNHEFACLDPVTNTWSAGNNTTSGFVHVFDMASLDGRSMCLFGATNPDDAVVICSPDGGSSWNQPAAIAPNLDVPGNQASAGFNRLYFGAAYNNRFYTQSPFYSKSKVFNPSTNTWSDGPDLLKNGGGGKYVQPNYGSKPTVFAGKLLYLSSYPGWGGKLFVFDGGRVTEGLRPISKQYAQVIDMQVYSGYLYALATGSKGGYGLIRTRDLLKWELGGTIAYTSDTAGYMYSMRILNDKLYVGNGKAEVFMTPLPAFSPIN